jgi:hypothetical protein
MLLARGADAGAEDSSGKTAAVYAAERNAPAMMLLLSFSGGKPDERS